jgi:cytochrome c peroxidase
MLWIALLACGGEPAADVAVTEPPAQTWKMADDATRKLFAPLPDVMASESNPVTPEKVELGRMLYYENRLSKNQDVACNTCHLLDRYGVDGTPTSTGHKAQKGGRNAPTVYNAGLHLAQFWDGRAADLEAQAKGPVLNPIEMAMTDEGAVVGVLKSIPGYQEPFAKAFPGESDAITYDNMARAIGAFERTLVTPSRFDQWLSGDDKALTPDERAGLDTFVAVGCTACHSGVAIGGQSYMKLGLVAAYETADVGRMEVTKNEADKHVFKVPSLRNIAKTGPYFHDGSVAKLDDAVRLMGKHQLGKDLTAEEVGSIVKFLEATTGELPVEKITKPALPESGPSTPKADPS